MLGLSPSGEGPATFLGARAVRHLLLPALHAVQSRVGFISAGALGYVSRRLSVPPAEAYGVASFYALFALTPRPKVVAHVCDDLACRLRGSERLCDELRTTLGPEGAVEAPSTWMKSPCLGLCEQAPAAMITAAGPAPRERSFGAATAPHVMGALAAPGGHADPRLPLPQAGDPSLRLLRRIGVVDPTSLDSYRAHGGYTALRKAIALGSAGVLREVTDAKLVGRGGAAFPTGRKWEAVARNPTRPHYLVCNADESEPGTFKDRVLMEDDPFALLESMTIAGLATGSEKGFVYLRAEYPLAHERLQRAIDQARTHGLLGDDVLGQGLRFDVEIRRGAGAYICGEETALFNSLEGFRGEPRNKPPFPVDVGLFGKPTVVNNVETLVNVLDIVNEGADGYLALGTEGSPGTRLFCVSGHVVRPGLYELPFGATLQSLLTLAGGVPGGRKVQTVLLGGAAGTFLGTDELETPLTFEDTRRIGATLGSGVVMVLDDTVPMVPFLARIAEFFRDESCGQCVPCRVGTVRVEELIARIARGKVHGSPQQERVLLSELGMAMRDASICGLGQTATSAIESAVRKLPIFPVPLRVPRSAPGSA
ncbi:MAG: NAD(P)H-dependent oxidoreductase subunit E [Polyangiales bacterium]